MNHTYSNQPIPADSTNIISINHSANIHTIEKILILPVHLVLTPPSVPASPIFYYGIASDPPSPSHDSSSESVTPKLNPLPRNNPPNMVPNITVEPDSDPISSYSSLSDSYDSSDNEYYKRIQRAKKHKNKRRSKTCFDDSIKKRATITSNLLIFGYKSKNIKFKLDEGPLQRWFYFLSFMNSLKFIFH